jgi:hypothetical protein
VVPVSWRVELATVGVFGGVGDARPRDVIATEGPVLRIDGFAIFGGVGIVSEAPDLEGGTTEIGSEVPEWEAAPTPA